VPPSPSRHPCHLPRETSPPALLFPFSAMPQSPSTATSCRCRPDLDPARGRRTDHGGHESNL
jgi:hypothetical protein